jgi:uncharacterized protein (TIGR01777 family)
MSNHAQKVLITGATGLVGRELCLKLFSEGYSLVALSRNAQRAKATLGIPCEVFEWDATKSEPPQDAYQGVSAIVHLAGESIAEGRWTEAKKKSLIDSRILSTRYLISGLKKSGISLDCYVGASAIGYYGSQGEKSLDENSNKGEGFLSDLTANWENEAFSALPNSVRAIALRIGLVMAREGGMLHKVAPLFRKGFGGKLGDGSQYMSWIHLDDLVQLIHHSLKTPSLQGPLNAVAPTPVTNAVFTDILNRTVLSENFIPAPKKPLELLLGEMGQMLFYSQNVSASKALSSGFKFQFPELPLALADLLGTGGDHKVVFKNWISETPENVYRFFGDEKNLEILTPPWLHFKVLGKSTPELHRGTEINYQLKLHGIPIRWTSVIEKWVPPLLFTDTQKKGPYKKWHHTHEFRKVQNGTLMTDTVLYSLPLGKLGEIFGGNYVNKDVKKIFEYRTIKINEAMGKLPLSST